MRYTVKQVKKIKHNQVLVTIAQSTNNGTPTGKQWTLPLNTRKMDIADLRRRFIAAVKRDMRRATEEQQVFATLSGVDFSDKDLE